MTHKGLKKSEVDKLLLNVYKKLSKNSEQITKSMDHEGRELYNCFQMFGAGYVKGRYEPVREITEEEYEQPLDFLGFDEVVKCKLAYEYFLNGGGTERIEIEMFLIGLRIGEEDLLKVRKSSKNNRIR